MNPGDRVKAIFKDGRNIDVEVFGILCHKFEMGGKEYGIVKFEKSAHTLIPSEKLEVVPQEGEE